jgi:hypothetical protein
MDSTKAARIGGKRAESLRWLRQCSGRRRLTDLVAFGGTVALAVAMRWQARDLVWALWTSSLVVGYATIVTTIVRGVREHWRELHLIVLFGGVGLLAFFTFHFGMFHFVHSVFLNMFFPLHGEADGFPNFVRTVGIALAAYWPFVVASLVSRLGDLDRPRGTPDRAEAGASGRALHMSLSAPYRNVVRMHILIFVFAGLHAAGLSRYAIYPMLAAYFFPWETLRRS